jgi:hypothetical protein
MSSVGNREQRLILDLLLRRKSARQFFEEFPVKPDDAAAPGLAMLQRALAERDSVGVEFGLYLGHRFGISLKYLDVLLALAGEKWHERHEDVIDGLAKLRSPQSIDVLYHTVSVLTS